MTLALPELGPYLGRLAAAPRARPAAWLAVDDLRLALATRLFKLAGSARMAGDAAPDVLTAARWSEAWQETVKSVAARMVTMVEGQLRQAAAASRLPKQRLERSLMTEADRRALTARLGEGGASLLTALEELERIRGLLSASPAAASVLGAEWLEAVAAAARRQESAWRDLEEALAREAPLWSGEIATIRHWVRPSWPFWLMTAALYLLAIWVGLVLGGYVAAPAPLTGAVSWFWDRF
ncbi:MAG: hypothetical protein ABI765_13110 [Gemmatimonadota bacterium]